MTYFGYAYITHLTEKIFNIHWIIRLIFPQVTQNIYWIALFISMKWWCFAQLSLTSFTLLGGQKKNHLWNVLYNHHR